MPDGMTLLCCYALATRLLTTLVVVVEKPKPWCGKCGESANLVGGGQNGFPNMVTLAPLEGTVGSHWLRGQTTNTEK